MKRSIECPGASRTSSSTRPLRRRCDTFARSRTCSVRSGELVSERNTMGLTVSARSRQQSLLEQGFKWCQQCNLEKPLSEFYKRSDSSPSKELWRSYCRSCHARYSQSPDVRTRRKKKQYHKRPQHIANNRFRTTGFTQELWDAAWVMQDGLCAICQCDLLTYHNPHVSKGPKMCADHDHATMRPRGILCSTCNKALGFFKDSPDRLRAAIAYLADPPLAVLV